MKMIKISLFSLLIIAVACKNDSGLQQANRTQQHNSESIPLESKFSDETIEFDEKSVLWMAKDSYYPFLQFYHCSNCVYIQFDGSTSNEYKVGLVDGKIMVSFSNFIDPKMSFPTTQSEPPKYNEPFMILTIINDSIMKATYLNQKWVNEINKITTKNSHPYFSNLYLKKNIAK